MISQLAYQSVVMLLLVVGLVPALVFLGQHRPKQWKRAAAWDASGLVMVAALWYLRSIILIIWRWPGAPPHGWLDAAFAVLMLMVIDTLMILRLVSYRAFVERTRMAEVISERKG